MTASDTTGGRGSAGATGQAGLLDELRWRGMLHQHSSGLAERLASGGQIKGYNGFDPTGPSLHIGHLVPIFGLIQLQRAGGVPVVVMPVRKRVVLMGTKSAGKKDKKRAVARRRLPGKTF